MVLLFNTATTDPNDVRSAYMEALTSQEVPMTAELDITDLALRARLDAWQMSPGVHFLRQLSTPYRLWRTNRQVRVASPERAAFGFNLGPAAHYEAPAASRALRSGDVHLVDQTTTMDYISRSDGGSFAFIVDVDRLGVPVDTVRAAVPKLAGSPLYGLFRSHLQSLGTIIDDLPDGLTPSIVSSATLDLARAVVTTAADDDKRASEAMHRSEYTRVAAYVRQHLRDPQLGAETIARANHMSVRQVYRIWEANTATLSEYIIACRLEGVRNELARSESRRTSISRIAAEWGFINAAHFSRRFRAAYSITAQEWRRGLTDGSAASESHAG